MASSEPDIPPEVLQEQLDRLRGHANFKHSAGQMEILEILLAQEPMKATTIAESYSGAKTDHAVRAQLKRLRDKLEQYYFKEGKADPVIIEVQIRSCRVTYRRRSQAQEEQRRKKEPGITILSKWKSDHAHDDLMRNACAGSELRVQTTGFINIPKIHGSIQCAIDNGAHVRILLTDPDCPIFRARFRLRPDMSVSEFRDEISKGHKMLKMFAERKAAGSLEYRLCDIMPFGYFLQGESAGYGPWMLIGLMPAAGSYMDGPMIEIRPAEAALWKLFERTWEASWNSPMDDPDK